MPNYKKIAIKGFLFLTPLYLLIAAYIILDPFKVIFNYSTYQTSGNNPVALNKDFLSVENLINNSPTSYTAFIFGNSRSMFYSAAQWQQFTSAKKTYHFDASSETLYGIYKKVQFLKRNNVQLKHALLVVDSSLLAYTENSKGELFIKDPKISGESYLQFQFIFLKTFLNRDFLINYLDYKFTGNINRYSLVLNNQNITYIQELNEFRYADKDTEILDIDKYYKVHSQIFYTRKNIPDTSAIVLFSKQKEMLNYIKSVFDTDSTEYKIIINPLYNQEYINPTDLNFLRATFGANNVYNLSGINEITASKFHYYEKSHYRPYVAEYILNKIYNPHDTVSMATWDKIHLGI